MEQLWKHRINIRWMLRRNLHLTKVFIPMEQIIVNIKDEPQILSEQEITYLNKRMKEKIIFHE